MMMKIIKKILVEERRNTRKWKEQEAKDTKTEKIKFYKNDARPAR